MYRRLAAWGIVITAWFWPQWQQATWVEDSSDPSQTGVRQTGQP